MNESYRMKYLADIINEAHGSKPAGERVKNIKLQDITMAKKYIAAAEMLGFTMSLVGSDLEDKHGDIGFGDWRVTIRGNKLYSTDPKPEELKMGRGSELWLELYVRY